MALIGLVVNEKLKNLSMYLDNVKLPTPPPLRRGLTGTLGTKIPLLGGGGVGFF